MQLLLLHFIILFILALLRVQGRPELSGILLIDDNTRRIDDLFSFLLGLNNSLLLKQCLVLKFEIHCILLCHHITVKSLNDFVVSLAHHLL